MIIKKLIKKSRSTTLWLYYFLRFAIRQFYSQRGLQIASSLAYATLLSLVPLLAVVYVFMGNLPMFEKFSGTVQHFIISNFVPAFGDTIQQYLGEFSRKASQLTVTNVAFLFVIALMLMVTIDNALNQIWHVRVHRKPAARFLVYWAILTLGPILMGVGIVTTTYVLSLSAVSSMEATLGLQTRLLSYLPFLTSAAAFTLLYAWLPNCAVSRRHAITGGLVAAALFEFAKYAFGVYVSSSSIYQDVYGAIAVIPIFLIWIYTSWVIVILGAHITFCLSAFRLTTEISGSSGPEWSFTDACRVIRALWVAQKSGSSLTINELRNSGIRLPHYQINEIMNALHDASWIQMDPAGSWLLSRDMSEMTLMDLYRIIPNRIRLKRENITGGDETVQLGELMHAYNENLSQLLNVPFKSVFSGNSVPEKVSAAGDDGGNPPVT